MSLFKGKYLAPQEGPGLHLLLLTRRQRWENRCDFEVPSGYVKIAIENGNL